MLRAGEYIPAHSSVEPLAMPVTSRASGSKSRPLFQNLRCTSCHVAHDNSVFIKEDCRGCTAGVKPPGLRRPKEPRNTDFPGDESTRRNRYRYRTFEVAPPNSKTSGAPTATSLTTIPYSSRRTAEGVLPELNTWLAEK